MSEFLAGALIGELLFLIITVLVYFSYPYKGDFWRGLNYKNILISILVAGCLGGLLGISDSGSGSTCRSFSNSKAESC